MQLTEPRCSERRCLHIVGIKVISDMHHVNVCKAFPDGDGIPFEIAYGDNKHTEPFPGDHGIQYEREQ